MSVYTSGDWHVKSGEEGAFIEAWREFARWSSSTIDPTAWAKLLRDADDPSHFLSFGRWKDQRTVDEWRESDGFRENVGRLREMTDSMQVRTLSVAAEAGLVAVAT